MNKNDYGAELEKKGAIGFVPYGNSMWPTLRNGRQSVIVSKKTGRLKKYDVAFYVRSNGAYVLHRVMEVTDYGYIICGDSQFEMERVKEEQVIGVMESFFRGKKCIECTDAGYIKRVVRWFKHKKIRKFRLGCFFLRVKIKNKFKKIFFKSNNGEE